MTPLTLGQQVWFGMEGGEECVSFIVELDGDAVKRLWAVSRLAGGIVWVDNPPQAETPQPGCWWPK
jgi:hypothetical protein